MVYLYQSGSDIGFVQLVSDGKTFTPLSALAGPANVSLDDARIIIGDLDGNGCVVFLNFLCHFDTYIESERRMSSFSRKMGNIAKSRS